MKTTLSVSECFYSIQGEGLTMGIPAVFLRLSGCNLLCESKHWRCDTIEVWRKGTKTPFPLVINEEWIAMLRDGAHLVLTGGEPMLHQKALINYFEWFRATYNFIPVVEIETNATVHMLPGFELNVNFWNVSPKLDNSGEPYERRVKPLVLKELDDIRRSQTAGVIYKFVISSKDDWIDIMQDYGEHIEPGNIVLMPAGENQKQLSKTRPIVAEMAKKLCLRYSDRLHVGIWNQKTGV